MLPSSALLYLTNHCDLMCKHCFLVDDQSINTAFLKKEAVFRVIDDFKKNNVYLLAISGGDPLMHPDIFEIIRYTRSAGILPLLGSSGMRINRECAQEIYDSGVRCVQLSLDGIDEDKNAVLRGAGTFRPIEDAVGYLQEEGVHVNLAICLTKENKHSLREFLEYSYAKNIYKVKVQFWFESTQGNQFCSELDREEKSRALKICKEFEADHDLSEWIYCQVDSESELGKIHRGSLVIEANGNMKFSNENRVMGNIYQMLPSECVN